MATFLDTGVRDLTDFVVYESYYTRDGGFSEVYRGELNERPALRRAWSVMRWLSPGAKRVKVAVKVIRTNQYMNPSETERTKRDLMNEIATWSQLEHFNVLPLLGVVRGVHGRVLPSLVSPWCEHGSVFEYIKTPRRAADCISLILTSSIPYQEVSRDWSVVNRILQGSLPIKPSEVYSEELAHLQATAWPILEECWAHDPNLRPNISELQHHLHRAILARETHHFYGPVFEFEAGKGRPSVIGNEDQIKADSEPDEVRALALLACSAIGHHWNFDGNRACTIQVQIGQIHISRAEYSEARAHLEAAKEFFKTRLDYQLVITCRLALAEVAQDFGEKIHQYTSALALCRSGSGIDQEALIVRALGNTVLEQSDLAKGEEKVGLIKRARLYLMGALSLYTNQANLKLQVQVRCELLLLEMEAGNEGAAQNQAAAAFQCACETRDQNFAEEVCDYLKSTIELSEATCNAFDLGLHRMKLDILERMLQSRIHLPRADSQL
ncbi:hypothetical protein FRC07_006443 [Ceratobasidium sp. 392]|nr:hypothetical protein FRC07_006443 [Ceratobasidium sp. 392]